VTINQDYLILDCIEYKAIAVASVGRQFAIAANPFEQMAAVFYGVISWTDGK
jgi:hypothetical protein